MIQYILEILAFQLLFLVVYDLFLKRETFFQWNRFYLIGTFVLSMVLPWIKIEALKTQVSQDFVGYPAFMFQLQDVTFTAVEKEESWLASLAVEELIFGIGAILAALWFGYKLLQIYRLKQDGTIRYYQDFTKVMIKKSEQAFSFFKIIFLGEEIKKESEANIVAHELVHIKQWHSVDLLFFELMRIAFWFNPLVYVYQNRIAELHEFIADSIVAKTNKKEHYQQLLSEAFKTQNISFVNQFFNKSLIKKRIVMLSKSKSKKVYQFKYMLLLPMVLGMLVYTSCEQEIKEERTLDAAVSSTTDAALIAEVNAEIDAFEAAKTFSDEHFKLMKLNKDDNTIFSKEDFFRNQLFFRRLFEKGKDLPEISIEAENLLQLFKLPSTALYNAYVDRKKAFQILDKNLKHSISPSEYAIRLIKESDKNLGAGEFIEVANSKDLTSTEIKNVNQALEQIKGSRRFLSLSDNNNSFLITALTQNSTQIIVEEEFEVKIGTESISVPFAIVEEVPIFPGCESAEDKKTCFQEKMNEHIRKNFNYPAEALEAGIQGRVSTVFIISKKGTIKNIRMRGPDKLLEAEVLRIIERLPKMKPGKHKGKKVDVPFSIPVNFQFSGSTYESIIKVKNEPESISVPFSRVEEVPIFPGCESAEDKKACFREKMNEHIRKNFNYPLEAQEAGIQGRVSTVFIISKEGTIKNIRMRGPDKLLEEEVRRIIERLPQMIPGKQKGETIDVPFSIPVNFRLSVSELKESTITAIKLHTAESMLGLVEKSTKYDLVPTQIGMENNEIARTIEKYNKLVLERRRLLETSNASNPIIVSLDEQLTVLKIKMKEQLKIEILKYKNQLKN